ncbi:MAG: polysaccharide biosynthesis/export family protein [Planctomycetes bacterium]|nr:polysaccharide biosynthesis/export family protein [Planctomycetota bacterium]
MIHLRNRSRQWLADAAFGTAIAAAISHETTTGGADSTRPMAAAAPLPVVDAESAVPLASGSANDVRDGALAEPGVQVIKNDVRLCQALSPASPYPIWGVDSAAGNGCGEVGWDSRGMIPWEQFAQGEYIGHARTPQVPEYRLREADVITVYYRRTREELSRPYELEVGDRIRVESLTAGSGAAIKPEGNETVATADSISRELVIQPDGTITLPMLGQVRATRRTVPSLRDELEERYKEYFHVPSITVTPMVVNTKLEDLLNTVDSRAGVAGGLQIQVTVTPAGDIQLPGIGDVFVQSLTLAEAKQEIDARYGATIPGVQVTLVLAKRAQRFIYVLGEVAQPGRFELQGPTTAMQGIALAGGWRIGSNLRQVVVFRRGPDWRLMATMLDLRGALYGRRPVPADDIWLSDSDIVLVTKSPIQQVDEVIEQVFTRGLYSVMPREALWNVGFVGESSL